MYIYVSWALAFIVQDNIICVSLIKYMLHIFTPQKAQIIYLDVGSWQTGNINISYVQTVSASNIYNIINF